LSPAMQTALKQLVVTKRGSPQSTTCQTIEALRHRRLINADATPTEPGVVLGLSLASLGQQCEILGIQTERVYLQKRYADPAVDGMYYFARRGNQCCYSEGIVLKKILYCLYFHRLASLTKEGWKQFMAGLGTLPLAIGLGLFDFEDYVKNYDTIEGELIETVMRSNRNIFLSNYRELFKKGFCWFGADELFAAQVFDILGTEQLAKIVRVLLTDPYAYATGWPDLMVIRENEVEFVEVKTSDKLIISQLITIHAMIESAGLNVQVLQISPSKAADQAER
jgi:hypothetical protein